ncbi:MAG: metal ABC transporter substrate-binding protein [Oscillospiraceae bacterium]|nr:metal ABC transporter substrate-binding protein [Oscillospiraceae bacterium]
MKPITGFLLASLMTASLLTGCSTESKPVLSEGQADKLKIVCADFPQYDWMREILGSHADAAELVLLQKNGTDPHNFQPSATDIAQISDCDLFLFIGGESDSWARDAVADAINPEMKYLSLLDTLGSTVKTEEHKDGMEAEEAESDEAPEYDEHAWLSLPRAHAFCLAAASQLGLLDPANAEDYQANAEAYNQKLDALDNSFAELAGSAKQKTLLFGDRFPFRYFVDDYGFDYYAAFPGCSAETEAGFETVVFLAEKVDELGLDTVFTIENSDSRIAQTIIDNTKEKNQQIAVLNSMQSVTEAQIQNGTTYLSLMQENYDVLKAHLK